MRYTYREYLVDRNKQQIGDKTRESIVEVVDTLPSFRGRMNVAVFASEGTREYVSYDTSGDLYRLTLRDDDDPDLWIRMPIASRRTSTTDSLCAVGTAPRVRAVMIWAMPIPGFYRKDSPDSTDKAVILVNRIVTEPACAEGARSETLQYAPSLGIPIRIEWETETIGRMHVRELVATEPW